LREGRCSYRSWDSLNETLGIPEIEYNLYNEPNSMKPVIFHKCVPNGRSVLREGTIARSLS
jgi:hypothetical protein